MQEPRCRVYVSSDSKDQQKYQSMFIIRFLVVNLRERYGKYPRNRRYRRILNFVCVNLSILSRWYMNYWIVISPIISSVESNIIELNFEHSAIRGYRRYFTYLHRSDSVLFKLMCLLYWYYLELVYLRYLDGFSGIWNPSIKWDQLL